MGNLQLILMVGALLGWSIAAITPGASARIIVSHVLAGSFGSFAGAYLAHGGTLYGGLGPQSWGSAVAGALILTGLTAFGARRLRR